MQMVDEISTSGGIPVIFFPLSVILIVSGLKDLFEDLKRKRSDMEENNRKILVLEKEKFIQKTWRELRVGNIVKILENEYFPADLLLIQSSDEKGICYIETKNLDGETNLKRKIVDKDFERINGMDEELVKKKFYVYK
jgi:phospholipid-transporting ATPase